MDIVDPLNPEEWNCLAKAVEETAGLGWFQILPVGQKSCMPYQFNCLHILPKAKIPVKKLPIDVFYKRQISINKIRDKLEEGNLGNAKTNLSKREELEELAYVSGLIMLPEFQFNHCLLTLTEDTFKRDSGHNIMEAY